MVSVVTSAQSMFAPLACPKEDSRRRVGGWRMQLERAQLERTTAARSRTPPVRVSRGCLEHLRDWGQGISSAPRVWRHAAAAVADGRTDTCIKRLHGCGTSQRDQNIAAN